MTKLLQYFTKKEKASPINTLLKSGPLLGASAGLLVGAIYVLLWGISPVVFFQELLVGAFGSKMAIGSTINRMTPLLLIGTGTALAFKAGANNIGQEGQVFVGGIATALIAHSLPGLPAAIGIPAILLLSMVIGALYAGIAVLFRLFKGTNELLITLLLNYVSKLLVAALINGPLIASMAVSFPQTDPFGEQFLLKRWPNFGYMHAGILIAMPITIFAAYIMWRTPAGLRLRMVGSSPLAARTAGVNTKKEFVAVMLLSGALCGLAGSIEVIGTTDCLKQGFGEALGFDGLAVALLGGSNPAGVLPASLFFGALRVGMQSMQRSTGIPSSILDLIKGCIIIFIMIGSALKALNRFHTHMPL